MEQTGQKSQEDLRAEMRKLQTETLGLKNMVGAKRTSLESLTCRVTFIENRICDVDELHNPSIQQKRLEKKSSKKVNKQQQNSGISSIETSKNHWDSRDPGRKLQ